MAEGEYLLNKLLAIVASNRSGDSGGNPRASKSRALASEMEMLLGPG